MAFPSACISRGATVRRRPCSRLLPSWKRRNRGSIACRRCKERAKWRLSSMDRKPRIAHLAGPNATIQNTPPLVTSNKARAKHDLSLLADPDGKPGRFDVLRPQRLAAPVTVYVEQFSAHPLEADAAELYGAPDGWIGGDGQVRREREGPGDKPVYEVELRPEDGLYPLPYMARQADLRAWEEECAEPGAPEQRARQAFHPDGA